LWVSIKPPGGTQQFFLIPILFQALASGGLWKTIIDINVTETIDIRQYYEENEDDNSRKTLD